MNTSINEVTGLKTIELSLDEVSVRKINSIINAHEVVEIICDELVVYTNSVCECCGKIVHNYDRVALGAVGINEFLFDNIIANADACEHC